MRKVKTVLIFLFCLAVSAKSNGSDDPVTKIILIKTDFSTEVIVNVDCDLFNRQFPADFRDTFYINNKDMIRLIVTGIERARPAKRENLDTRAQLYLYHASGRIDSVCMGPSYSAFSLNHKLLVFDNADLRIIDTIDKKFPVTER